MTATTIVDIEAIPLRAPNVDPTDLDGSHETRPPTPPSRSSGCSRHRSSTIRRNSPRAGSPSVTLGSSGASSRSSRRSLRPSTTPTSDTSWAASPLRASRKNVLTAAKYIRNNGLAIRPPREPFRLVETTRVSLSVNSLRYVAEAVAIYGDDIESLSDETT